MDKPTVSELMALGISRTHAYDIHAGREAPSLPLALLILEKTGWHSKPIEGLSPDAIATLAANHASAKAA